MKIAITFIWVIVLFASNTFGQLYNKSHSYFSDTSLTLKKDTTKLEEHTIIEEVPSFPGGEEAMLKFVMDNTHYPREAKKNKIKGRVMVKFLVDKEGNVVDPKVTKGLGSGCDE